MFCYARARLVLRPVERRRLLPRRWRRADADGEPSRTDRAAAGARGELCGVTSGPDVAGGRAGAVLVRRAKRTSQAKAPAIAAGVSSHPPARAGTGRQP